MFEKRKVAAGELAVGYEFPTASYRLEPETVALYLKAVGAGGGLYRDGKLVPPTAIAAYAMATLADNMALPEGTIHTHQALEFKKTVPVGETITCCARVSRNQARGKFHFLNIDLDVLDSGQHPVLAGKTAFILPWAGDL
ncbi:MAG: MaoC family dehydratase [Chloroflexota bacterium]